MADKLSHEDAALRNGLSDLIRTCLLLKDLLSLGSPPLDNTARWPSANREKVLTRTQIDWHPDLGLAILQNCDI